MNYFKQILRFAKPYKSYGILNIICNIFYALFGTLSFIALIPMLSVLLKETEPVHIEPVYQGLKGAKSFLENYLNYYVTLKTKESGQIYVLTIMVGLVISMFLIKNIFNY